MSRIVIGVAVVLFASFAGVVGKELVQWFERRSSQTQIEATLVKTAQQMSLDLPKRMDGMTLVGVNSAGLRLVYTYRVETQRTKLEAFERTMRSHILSGFCSEPSTQRLLAAGVTYEWKYFDVNKLPVGSVVVNKNDCASQLKPPRS